MPRKAKAEMEEELERLHDTLRKKPRTAQEILDKEDPIPEKQGSPRVRMVKRFQLILKV